MTYKPSIFLNHPTKKNVQITLRELAQILGLSEGTIRVRWFQYSKNQITLEQLYEPRKNPKKEKIAAINTTPIYKKESVNYVFRPDIVFGNEIATYAAYHPDDLKNPILDDIIRTLDNHWMWNRYDIGSYPSKNQLVKRYLDLVETGKLEKMISL